MLLETLFIYTPGTSFFLLLEFLQDLKSLQDAKSLSSGPIAFCIEPCDYRTKCAHDWVGLPARSSHSPDGQAWQKTWLPD